MPEHIDPDKMDEIQNSEGVWIVDFWAEWCGPCRKLAPIFEDVSEELDQYSFGKVDMEENQQLGSKFGVRALPTILILKDGEEVARNAGMMQEDELKSWITENA